MTLSLLLLGFLIGVKHAIEADHVAAVATLASRASSVRDHVWLAGLWGVGHAAGLTALGAALILLEVALPPGATQALECVVGLVLVALGVDVLRRARRRHVHFHLHAHTGAHPHVHVHAHDDTIGHDPARHDHVHGLGGRALAVGTMHGLAGSAALVLLTAQATRSPWQGLAYLAVFGVGTIGGMMGLSLAISVPFRLSTNVLGRFRRTLETGLGTATVALGAWIAASTLVGR